MNLCESLREIVKVRFPQHDGLTLVRPEVYIAYAAHDRCGVSVNRGRNDTDQPLRVTRPPRAGSEKLSSPVST
jgi:hypothetical protein